VKKTTIINIIIAVIATLFIGAVPNRLNAQAYLSYDQTIGLIKTFDSGKHYTNGLTLDLIIQGMVDNDLYDYNSPYLSSYLTEGLKKRLIGGKSSEKIKKEAAAAEYPADGQLLELLYYTRQSGPQAFITDDDLRRKIGGKNGTGAAIKKSIVKLWKNKDITTNLIECLEGYPPETASLLADIIARTYYSDAAGTYENTDTSWASESLWSIYRAARLVELAKRSVVVKLLADNGYLQIPTVAYAEFEWSQGYYGYDKWPDVPIYLDPVVWTEDDVPGLQRLLGNPDYAVWAAEQLARM